MIPLTCLDGAQSKKKDFKVLDCSVTKTAKSLLGASRASARARVWYMAKMSVKTENGAVY